MSRRDSKTLDLFTWEPPELVARYDEQRVKAADLRVKIARAVSETLNDCGMTRAEVAKAMSEWLGEKVEKASLDAYASPAKKGHTLSFIRLIALLEVTRDRRLLQIAAEPLGWAVLEDRRLAWINVGQAAFAKREIERQFEKSIEEALEGGS